MLARSERYWTPYSVDCIHDARSLDAEVAAGWYQPWLQTATD